MLISFILPTLLTIPSEHQVQGPGVSNNLSQDVSNIVLLNLLALITSAIYTNAHLATFHLFKCTVIQECARFAHFHAYSVTMP